MSFSYSGQPGVVLIDTIRFLIGDTNPADPLLQDGELTFLLGQYNNSPPNAAIRAMETIIAKFTRLADEQVGQVRIQFSQKAEAARNMLVDLKVRLATEDMTAYAGGISKTDKEVQVLNNDRVPPDFRKHQMENDQIAPWTSQNDTTRRDEP